MLKWASNNSSSNIEGEPSTLRLFLCYEKMKPFALSSLRNQRV